MATFERWKITKYYDDVSGFLMLPRNGSGNYFTGSPSDIYPQKNLLKTDKTGYHSEIREDKTLLESNEWIWTNGLRFVSKNNRRGKPFLTGSKAGSYSFERDGLYFSVCNVTSVTPNEVRIEIYDSSATLIQSFTCAHIKDIRCVMANKSATEITIMGLLQDHQTKALPFAFTYTDYYESTAGTPLQFQSFLKDKKWDGIVKYSITKPSSTYVFTLLDYKEQWRGVVQTETLTHTNFGTQSVDHIDYAESSVFADVWNNDIVLYFYYDNDAYHEVIFNGGSLVGTADYSFSHIVTFINPYPDTAGYLEETISEVYDIVWSFTVAGIAGNYDHTGMADYYSKHINGGLYTDFMATGNHTLSAGWRRLNGLDYYSKINPYTTVSASASYSYSVGIGSPSATLPAIPSATVEYWHFSCAEQYGKITFPTKDNGNSVYSYFAHAGDWTESYLTFIANVFLHSINSDFSSLYYTAYDGAAYAYTAQDVFDGNGSFAVKWLVYYDPLLLFQKRISYAYTDKYNNHLLFWADSANINLLGTQNALAKITDKNLLIPVTLNFQFQQIRDFLGAV